MFVSEKQGQLQPVKWIIPNICMKDQKKREEKCLHYVGNSIQQTSI